MKKTMFLAKISALLNGISVVLLFGGFSGVSKSGSIFENEGIWRYYHLIISVFLILGIGGIILGLIIKINNYEVLEEISGTRGYKSLSTMLLVTSLFILLTTFALIWFAKFATF